MKSLQRLVSLALVLFSGLHAAAQPTVSNVRAGQTPGTTQVVITYDLVQAQDTSSNVTVEVSADGGATYVVAAGATGAVGAGIAPGTGKTITWNVGAQWPEQFLSNVKARVTVSAGFALIPAGTFTMGGGISHRQNEWPLHSVTLPAFYMARTHTTWAEWQTVRDWAVNHGYTDLAGVGRGKAGTHPVHTVSWYDVVKWCNARSEMEGLTPSYYTNDAQTTVYRTGNVDVTNAQVKWTGSGYRLPTEAEWEYAARGGLSQKRFPSGDTISHTQANYNSLSSSYFYDVSMTRGYHPTYWDGNTPNTNPVEAFAANGYGLHDMAGNVWQWCWDWLSAYTSSSKTSPKGPDSGFGRVVRGGSWNTFADDLHCATRRSDFPSARNNQGGIIGYGFRCARSSVP